MYIVIGDASLARETSEGENLRKLLNMLRGVRSQIGRINEGGKAEAGIAN